MNVVNCRKLSEVERRQRQKLGCVPFLYGKNLWRLGPSPIDRPDGGLIDALTYLGHVTPFNCLDPSDCDGNWYCADNCAPRHSTWANWGVGGCHGDTCAPIDHPAVPRHWPPTHCRCETPQSTELLTTSFVDPPRAPCFRRLSLYLHRLSRRR